MAPVTPIFRNLTLAVFFAAICTVSAAAAAVKDPKSRSKTAVDAPSVNKSNAKGNKSKVARTPALTTKSSAYATRDDVMRVADDLAQRRDLDRDERGP